MADIAVVFHWPLSEMLNMSLDELTLWWYHARNRSGESEDEQ
jgi:hypothetical protein